jgi:hypothetical protein
MSRGLSVLGVTLAFSISGCSGIFGADQSVILQVSEIDAPATIAPGSPLSVVLKVTTGGCLRFDRIEMTRVASGANVTVWGDDSSIGRNDIVCTSDIRTESHTMVFNPPFGSTFTISVYHGRLPGISETVEVR